MVVATSRLLTSLTLAIDDHGREGPTPVNEWCVNVSRGNVEGPPPERPGVGD